MVALVNGHLGHYVINLAILENHGDIGNAIHQNLNLVDLIALVVVEIPLFATPTSVNLLRSLLA